MASALTLTCDAPGCGAILETLDGHPVFLSMEAVRDAVGERNWAIWTDRRDVEHYYCPMHWRWSFSVRVPYWGRRRRLVTNEEGF